LDCKIIKTLGSQSSQRGLISLKKVTGMGSAGGDGLIGEMEQKEEAMECLITMLRCYVKKTQERQSLVRKKCNGMSALLFCSR